MPLKIVPKTVDALAEALQAETVQPKITAVWLRRIGDQAQVLVEIRGQWRLAIEEYFDAPFSHIAEYRDDGIRWPVDPVTAKAGVELNG